jgi:hypothetical protein
MSYLFSDHQRVLAPLLFPDTMAIQEVKRALMFSR